MYIYFLTHPQKGIVNTETSTILYHTLLDKSLTTLPKNALYVCVCDTVRERDQERKREERAQGKASAKQSKREII